MYRTVRQITFVCLALILANGSKADGPADNHPDNVRPVPPVGVKIPPEKEAELLDRCREIRALWQKLERHETASAKTPKPKAAKPVANAAKRLRSLAPEVLVFPRAVELAIEFQQFYKQAEFGQAMNLLDEAARRIEVIKAGGSWAEVVSLGDGQTQRLIIGGYRSRIDGSYQPYGVVVPKGLLPGDVRPRRLDLWFHGRGEKLSEVGFLHKQRVSPGQYTPADTFVLHPYGRYSNAFKFAGEIDVLESLQYIRSRLPVDSARISARGFSMGGAACWQFATHYADQFFAANPGAGFSETPEFLSFFQGEDARKNDPPFQQTLWQLYDCPPWAINLTHCPTVAYSGEEDRQKQAADVMEVALKKLDIDMIHIIGPKTAHKIHPDSAIEVEQRMASLAATATTAVPKHVQMATVSLRYHRMHWIDVQGLQAHWTPAHVEATINDESSIVVKTGNVTSLRFEFLPGQWPGNARGRITVDIDGTKLTGSNVRSDRSWEFSVSKIGGQWQAGKPDGLRKQPFLQGPIDDAFMDSFVFVLPKNKSTDSAVQAWIEAESQHAMLHSAKHFRGDVRVINEDEITDAVVATSNLICFGDPRAGGLIGKLAAQLPILWNDSIVKVGDQQSDAAGRVAVLIYPNPLNPNRYIVLNSGFTYREYDYLNNARQTPKLPDWALIDVRDGATTRLPGKVEAAGFFDERWQPK